MPVVEWFREQVRDARSGDRLDELADLVPESGLRRRRWWQGTPAITSGGAGDDGDDEYDEVGGQDDHVNGQHGGEAVLADPGSIAGQQWRAQPAWAGELSARSWRLQPHGPGLCHVIKLRPHGWDYVPPSECVGRAEHIIPGGGAICSRCRDALLRPLARMA